jgi:uncharacterized phage protein gp47/JayE
VPFARPTLAELALRNEAEIAARLGLPPLLPQSVLSVLARVFAGASHGLHGHLDYLAQQVVPLTSSGAELDRHVEAFGLERRAATNATGFATFTGTNGSSIPLNASLVRVDGQRFRTTASAIIAGGTALVPIASSLPGLEANTPPATALALASPIPGIVSAVVDASGLTGGQDAETDDELRERFRQDRSDPPQGGSEADYVRWSREVAGVTRVFVRPAYQGLGTVGVFFTVDDDPTGPIPSPAKVAEVQARIDDTTRRDSRPVTADVTVYAPTALPTSFTLSITPDTAAVRAAVEQALRDLLRREAEPGKTLTLTKIHEAISTAQGEEDHVLTVPAADLTALAAQLRTFDSVTFT